MKMKSKKITIISFIGAFLHFVLFAQAYEHDDKIYTCIHLLGVITWWTCGIINLIIDCTKK